MALYSPKKVREISGGEIVKSLGEKYRKYEGIKFKFINLETFTLRT